MATLANIADRAQNALEDPSAATWTQALIEEWVCEAIRDYNLYFRRTATTAYNISSSSTTLTLSRLCRQVMSVEYPTGEDPPTYLTRMDRYHPDFYKRDDNYDFEPVDEYGQTEDGGYSPYLVFSEAPDTGETVTVIYRAIHDAELESSDLVTIPDEHQHLLVLFVTWKAFHEQAMDEAKNPDTTTRLVQQMNLTAIAAEENYRRAMKQAIQMTGAGGWTTPWKADEHDRIY